MPVRALRQYKALLELPAHAPGARDLRSARYRGCPAPKNPMGPRALYLYRDGRDLLYRIHGTLEPWTIGTDISSGCIRLLPEDLIDLYDRVPTGAQVLVMKHLA